MTVGGDEYPEMEVTPEVAGALRDSGPATKPDGSARRRAHEAREASSTPGRHGEPQPHSRGERPRAVHRPAAYAARRPRHHARQHPRGADADHVTQTETADEQADEPDQFATEQQGTLGIDTDAEQVAEEQQVTLAGGDEAGPRWPRRRGGRRGRRGPAALTKRTEATSAANGTSNSGPPARRRATTARPDRGRDGGRRHHRASPA
ncbi:hypothetical protein C9J85_03140 [Haloferax sp. wsp5]|nr:hypothetical protein C9J85_03140 [Haloferax sp. wsp5]